MNESSKTSGGMGFWGGLALGGLGAAILMRMSQAKAPPPPPPPPMAPPAFLPPPTQMSGMAGMGWAPKNGIPTVPLPQESAARTAQIRPGRPPSHPSQAVPPAAQAQQGQVYEETFGGVEGGLGGESF